MKTDARVAVIGGGIVGVSVLYWLAKMGWTDTVLLERRNLTSGSTWHAAGNTTYFGPYPAMTELFARSIRTYLQAEEESGHSVSFHETGSLRLAVTQRELDLFHAYVPRYAEMNIPFQIRTPEEVAALHPFIKTDQIFGAAHTPTDGHVDPSGATHAMAIAARNMGATIEKFCPVHSMHRDDSKWILETEKGNVSAQHVVVATSFWSREFLQPLGLDLPLYATEHHEIITEDLPEIAALSDELPSIRDSHVSCNFRQEGDGILIGFYEQDPRFWATDGIPKDFIEELLPANMDRLMPHMEMLAERVPLFENAGIKSVNNGPMCLTPDGLPLLGPMPSHEGLWLATGFNVGIGTGGGGGEFLAHWITQGEPLIDLKIVHADRFGDGVPKEDALAAIKAEYARGYVLPDQI